MFLELHKGSFNIIGRRSNLSFKLLLNSARTLVTLALVGCQSWEVQYNKERCEK